MPTSEAIPSTSTGTTMPQADDDKVSQASTGPAMNVATAQPLGSFNDDQETFLKGYLENYFALCEKLDKKGTGPRKLSGVRGERKKWVIDNVYDNYYRKFCSDGAPHIQTLKDKITKWFANRAKTCPKDAALPTTAAKPPRAVNAKRLFTDDNNEKIKDMMNQERLEMGLTPQEANLRLFNKFSNDLYQQLDEEEQADYEEKAAQLNEERESGPGPDHIVENQANITLNTAQVLRDLIGDSWGQHGRVVFFVQGAFRDKDDKLRTFNTSVAEDPEVTHFAKALENYDETLRRPFKEWAGRLIPPTVLESAGQVGLAPGAILREADGFPRFPTLDPLSLAPFYTKCLLKEYITAAWRVGASGHPVPWEGLHASERTDILENPVVFASVTSLDPDRATMDDIYKAIGILLTAQGDGQRILRFSLSNIAASPFSTNPGIGDPAVNALRTAKNDAQLEPAIGPSRRTSRKGKGRAEPIPDFSPPLVPAALATCTTPAAEASMPPSQAQSSAIAVGDSDPGSIAIPAEVANDQVTGVNSPRDTVVNDSHTAAMSAPAPTRIMTRGPPKTATSRHGVNASINSAGSSSQDRGDGPISGASRKTKKRKASDIPMDAAGPSNLEPAKKKTRQQASAAPPPRQPSKR